MSSSSSVDLSTLTTAQIISYSSKSSFSLATDSYDTSTNHGSDATTSTDTINETVGVISSLEEQLTTIQANLEQMYVAALEGASASSDDLDKQTAYAQLRSLSAGIDELTNSYELDDTRVLVGQTFTFSSGNGTVKYEQENLSSSLEGGLELSEKQEGRYATLDIDYLSYLKDLDSLIYDGIEVSDVDYDMPENATTALDAGDYYLKVTYQEDESYVELTSLDGVVQEKIEGIDLTGVSSTTLQFKSGLQATIDYDETLLEDDYDWDVDGGNELYYTVTIDETYDHVLTTDTDGAIDTSTSAELAFDYEMKGDTGTLSFSVSAKDEDDDVQLDTGNYTMKFEYYDDKSSIWLYDEQGTLVGIERGIDVTEEGETEVDLGNGLIVTIENDNFTSDSRKTKNMGVEYTNGDTAYLDFDYEEYADQVAEAYEQVTEQLNSLYEADEAVTELYNYYQQATDSSSTSTDATVLAAQSVSSLLSDYIDTEDNPLFASSNASTSLTASADALFGSLESTYSSISDADYEVLAAYY